MPLTTLLTTPASLVVYFFPSPCAFLSVSFFFFLNLPSRLCFSLPLLLFFLPVRHSLSAMRPVFFLPFFFSFFFFFDLPLLVIGAPSCRICLFIHRQHKRHTRTMRELFQQIEFIRSSRMRAELAAHEHDLARDRSVTSSPASPLALQLQAHRGVPRGALSQLNVR